jgi:serine/threonine-protein kinase
LLTKFQATQLLAGRHRGFRIGPYKVLDKLTRTGSVPVFLCEQVVMRRRVVVKVLPHESAKNLAVRERFYRDARAAALLDHPNIVHTHDVNSAGELHYLVMEYVDGTDLQSTLDSEGPMPIPRAVGCIMHAAAGLQYAHQKGVIHRDIRPANLVLTKDGIVKVMDMGLARSLDGSRLDVAKSQELGAVAFLAPELALETVEIDARVDVYSLGATLYALVTGKPPFEGTAAQSALAVQLRVPPPLAQIRPEVPPALSDAVARMMTKNPAERFQSAAEVIAALTPFSPSTDIVPGSTVVGQQTLPTTPVPAAPRISATNQEPLPSPKSWHPSSPGKAVTSHIFMPSTPNARAAATSTSNRGFWLGIAGTVLAVAVIVGLVIVVKRATQHRPPPGPIRTVHNVEAAHPDVEARPKQAVAERVTYRFAASEQQRFFERRRGRDTLQQTGTGGAPRGWTFGCWKTETSGEFMIEEVVGRVGFGLRCLEGEPAVQLNTTFDGILKSLDLGERYAVRFHYFAEENAKGVAAVRVKGFKNIGRVQLNSTNGQWLAAEATFTAAEDMLDFTVHVSVADPRSGIYITDLEFVEMSPAAALKSSP